ncbi:MAG: TfoX/Sxy family protein [SAR324 cluster bacterium]|nr:TfoX/Sxy family protein [SAR324 cluster bacterium]
MANSKEFVQKMLDDLSPLGDVTARPMFGGHGVFLGGRMFALISKDVIYLKADDENKAEFAAAGMKPYGKMPYYQTPPAAMDDPRRLEYLGGAAVAAAVRGGKKKSKKNKSRKS